MKRLSVGMMFAAVGMCVAVALLMLFAAEQAPWLWLGAICLFVASLMTWIPAYEDGGLLYAFIAYVITSAIALLICPGLFTYLYVLLFGHYGIVLLLLRRYIADKLLRFLVMMLYCNAMIALGLVLGAYVFYYDVQTLMHGLPIWATILILEAGLVVYHFLYRICCDLFDMHLRKTILPRRSGKNN